MAHKNPHRLIQSGEIIEINTLLTKVDRSNDAFTRFEPSRLILHPGKRASILRRSIDICFDQMKDSPSRSPLGG
jgi:hypothetical protein